MRLCSPWLTPPETVRSRLMTPSATTSRERKGHEWLSYSEDYAKKPDSLKVAHQRLAVVRDANRVKERQLPPVERQHQYVRISRLRAALHHRSHRRPLRMVLIIASCRPLSSNSRKTPNGPKAAVTGGYKL